jgi:hypothetical protein
MDQGLDNAALFWRMEQLFVILFRVRWQRSFGHYLTSQKVESSILKEFIVIFSWPPAALLPWGRLCV